MSETKPQTDAEKQQFSIQRTYVKDMSFEAPMGPEAFLLEKQPGFNEDLAIEVHKVADEIFETVLRLTITATLEEKTVFLVEIQQAGLFVLKGFEEQQLTHIVNVVCPQIIFPYAREAIDSLLVKATFPPLMLPPVNFESLFARSVAKQAETTH